MHIYNVAAMCHFGACLLHSVRLLTYLLTYLLHGAVLLEKLTGLQLVKKFPAFHGTRRFITALTSVRHLSLSGASPIQSIYPHPSSWRSVLILSTHLRLGFPSGLFPSGFPTKTLYAPLCALVELKFNSMKVRKSLLLVVLNVVRMLKYCFITKHLLYG